jgi:hypothetical protein
MDPARPTLEYLVCPECGTQYLARAQPAAGAGHETPPRRDRWFRCERCNKRVKSVDPEAAGPLTIDGSVE